MEFTKEEIEQYEKELKSQELKTGLAEREESASKDLTQEELVAARILGLKPSEYLKSKNEISVGKREFKKMQNEATDKLLEGRRIEEPKAKEKTVALEKAEEELKKTFIENIILR